MSGVNGGGRKYRWSLRLVLCYLSIAAVDINLYIGDQWVAFVTLQISTPLPYLRRLCKAFCSAKWTIGNYYLCTIAHIGPFLCAEQSSAFCALCQTPIGSAQIHQIYATPLFTHMHHAYAAQPMKVSNQPYHGCAEGLTRI